MKNSIDSRSGEITSLRDILDRVQCPKFISTDYSALQRGIDNYHIDVHLSDKFSLQAYSIIEAVVKRVVAGQRALPGNTEALVYFRTAYSEMMQTSYHRVKTDFTPEVIRFLHFAVIKHVLLETKSQLNKLVA